jgi:hypothetical protein
MLGVVAIFARPVINSLAAGRHHGLDGIPGGVARHNFGQIGYCKANAAVGSAGHPVFGKGISCEAGFGFQVGYVMQAGQGGLPRLFKVKKLGGGG